MTPSHPVARAALVIGGVGLGLASGCASSPPKGATLSVAATCSLDRARTEGRTVPASAIATTSFESHQIVDIGAEGFTPTALTAATNHDLSFRNSSGLPACARVVNYLSPTGGVIESGRIDPGMAWLWTPTTAVSLVVNGVTPNVTVQIQMEPEDGPDHP